jgi:hypothetical protein
MDTLNKFKNFLLRCSTCKRDGKSVSERDFGKKTCTIVEELPMGSGTVTDPFIVSTPGHLLWLAQNERCRNSVFRQTEDIDAGEIRLVGGGFPAIGSSSVPFSGTYDGNGHVISGLSISKPGTDCQGLFGTTMNACICNLGLENVNIKGLNNVGGLVGYMNGGLLKKCRVTGRITGSYYVGGLCGKADFPDISDCYATARIHGEYFCGGLTGKSQAGTITGSYSTASISGVVDSQYIGNLVGHNVGNSTRIEKSVLPK